MELNRQHFCTIIFYNFQGGLTQQQCIGELNSIFGDETPSRTSVYRWYGEFNWGRSLLQDEFREGRLKSIVVPETIDAVCQLILQDLHVTYREIETTLGISGTSIHSILQEHLTVKKICSRWMPHNLSIVQTKAHAENTLVVLRNMSMTLWQVINRGFMRMSPKVNSSRLYGCFKMRQIQQNLLSHEALPTLLFRKNWICRNHTARTTPNSQFWVVSQEIRKTNRRRHSSPR